MGLPMWSDASSDQNDAHQRQHSERLSTTSRRPITEAVLHPSHRATVTFDSEATRQQGVPIIRLEYPEGVTPSDHRSYVEEALNLAREHGYPQTGVMEIISNLTLETHEENAYHGLPRTGQASDWEDLRRSVSRQHHESEYPNSGQYTVQEHSVENTTSNNHVSTSAEDDTLGELVPASDFEAGPPSWVTSPYAYVGIGNRTLFAMHTEDLA